jgi:hypothetical protein
MRTLARLLLPFLYRPHGEPNHACYILPRPHSMPCGIVFSLAVNPSLAQHSGHCWFPSQGHKSLNYVALQQARYR